MSYFLGIGTGLLLLVAIWGISIFLIVITSRLKSPYNLIGLSSLAFTLLLTSICIALPRKQYTDTEDKEVEEEAFEKVDYIVYIILPLYLIIASITLVLNIINCVNYLLETKKTPVYNVKPIHFDLKESKRKKTTIKNKLKGNENEEDT